MDWIDKKILEFKDKIRMKSLRKTMSLYIFIAIIAVLILYFLTLVFCNGWINLVYNKYLFDVNSHTALDSLVGIDKFIIIVIRIIRTYSILLYSIIAIIITSNMFYKNKFEQPLNILKTEAEYISRSDLSFSCTYTSGDEMEEICEAFDKMRIQLSKNNERIWSLMEGQRQLNSAFAHDLRTPLTVMQGYIELLIKYYPQGKISDEKLMENLTLMQSQINNLKDFSMRMKDVQDIEAIDIRKELKDLNILESDIQKVIKGLKVNSGINMKIYNNLCVKKGYFDEGIILQVVENLLSNALTYAYASIDIIMENDNDLLSIYVRDDGKGFSKKDLYSASRPYYNGREKKEGHFGMGLAICKILCEKHGGKLSLNNSTRGGAIACVSFYIS